MIRCALCMVWFHNVCVGEDRRYVGVWTCVSCRGLPALVLNLQTQMNDVLTSIATYQRNEVAQKDELNRLKLENNKLMQKVSNLQNTNSDLTKLIETMSDISTPHISESSNAELSPDVSISVPTNNKFAPLSPPRRHPKRFTTSIAAAAGSVLRSPQTDKATSVCHCHREFDSAGCGSSVKPEQGL